MFPKMRFPSPALLGKGAARGKWEFLATEYAEAGKLSLSFFIEAGVFEDIPHISRACWQVI